MADQETANKEHLANAASAIHDFCNDVQGIWAIIQAKVQTLVQQAKSPQSTPTPEDLTAEFNQLDQSVAGLRSFADTLRAASTGTEFDVNAPYLNAPPVVGSQETGPHGQGPADQGTLNTTESGAPLAPAGPAPTTPPQPTEQTTAQQGGPTTADTSTGSPAATSAGPTPDQAPPEATAPTNPAEIPNGGSF